MNISKRGTLIENKKLYTNKVEAQLKFMNQLPLFLKINSQPTYPHHHPPPTLTITYTSSSNEVPTTETSDC